MQMRVSSQSLLLIAEQVEGALADGPPLDQFGVAVEGGKLRVQLDRGAPLAVLGLVGLVLVLGSVAATAYALRLRERRQQQAALGARRLQLAAAEAERGRIAREIHDGPLQDLHAARVQAEANSSSDSESADSQSKRGNQSSSVASDVGAVARELRAIAEGLRPPALSRFGLPAALSSHAIRVAERFPHVHLRVSVEEHAPALDAEAEASLFRVAQEAITNAVRHGNARTVDLEYVVEPSAENPERVHLVVRDDGIGLPEGLDVGTLALAGHFGMAGMQERAALLGGTLTMMANLSGQGTIVSVVAPWDCVAHSSPTS